MRRKLYDGMVADWSATDVAIYATPVDGYRLLLIRATLDNYVPAWGTRADTVTEWRAVKFDSAHRPVPVGTHDLDTQDAVEEWLLSLI